MPPEVDSAAARAAPAAAKATQPLDAVDGSPRRRGRWARLRSALRVEPLSTLYERGTPNSIGFLRFLLASLVIISHSFRLGGFGAEPLSWNRDGNLGRVAVACFFILSGFLISRSYVTSRSPLRYLWQRVLRILPGYWVCLAVIAFGFAPLHYWLVHHELGLSGFLAPSGGPLEYVTANFWLAQRLGSVDGLPTGIPMPGFFDGALWSLVYEFRCYLAVGAIGLLGLLRRWRAVGGVLVGALFVVMLLKYTGRPGLFPWLAGLGVDYLMVELGLWFAAGVLFYLASDRIPLHPAPFAVAAVVVVLGTRAGYYHHVGPVAMGYVLFWLARALPLSWWDRRGDFSYGLYIYGFPVQQTLALVHAQRLGLVPFMLLSLCIASALAVASFKLVEQPAQGLKNLGRARQATTTPA
jgi:peptidoglycan/LPS O-acetylase OafA/YrhL